MAPIFMSSYASFYRIVWYIPTFRGENTAAICGVQVSPVSPLECLPFSIPRNPNGPLRKLSPSPIPDSKPATPILPDPFHFLLCVIFQVPKLANIDLEGGDSICRRQVVNHI